MRKLQRAVIDPARGTDVAILAEFRSRYECRNQQGPHFSTWNLASLIDAICSIFSRQKPEQRTFEKPACGSGPERSAFQVIVNPGLVFDATLPGCPRKSSLAQQLRTNGDCRDQVFLSNPIVVFDRTGELNKSAPCNSLCHCNSPVYDPVCGIDDLSYFSPCHAGCTIMNDDKTSAVRLL